MGRPTVYVNIYSSNYIRSVFIVYYETLIYHGVDRAGVQQFVVTGSQQKPLGYHGHPAAT